MLVEVGGFAGLSGVQAAIREAVSKGETPFIMITGKSGTGRSSLANYLLTLYCDVVAVPPNRLIVPHREYPGHSKLFAIKKWFGFLRTEINRRRIGLDRQVRSDLQMYLRESSEATLEPDFQDIAGRISAEIAVEPHNSRFAYCIENVEDPEIINAALSIFSGAPTICVFVVQDYNEQQTNIVTPFRQKCKKLTGYAILELNRLSALEARNVVDQLWGKCSTLRNPFDLDCIERDVFDDGKHRAIGLTLTLMANLIDNKLANHPVGPMWGPDAPELEFTCDQLRKLVPVLEKTLL